MVLLDGNGDIQGIVFSKHRLIADGAEKVGNENTA